MKLRPALTVSDLKKMDAMFKNDVPFSDICQHFNLKANSKRSIWKKAAYSGALPLSEKILELLHQNVPGNQICKILNCSHNHVYSVKRNSSQYITQTDPYTLSVLILEEAIKLTETLTKNKP